ncbi:hypothetical protein PG993_004147 [Apiospora rasikravindrae]|uniref:Uncharacterized protein n=1 Tax=Apiospora rasikravindrae TaxID=990691 RepID=A0ABR1TBZ7_9PEZI
MYLYFPNTTWTRLCFAVAVIQGLLALALEAYVFTTVEEGLDPAAYQGNSGHTVPMYLALFIFAFVYEIIIVYDALRLNSMIQLVGLCIYNFLLLIYAAAQPLHPAVIAVIVVQAVATLALVFLTYKLHFEFAWVVYKVIHADLSMKKRLLNFQIYLALIKFDLFFLLGFLVQIAALINNPKHDPELGLSVAGIAVAIIVMCCAIYVAKIEHKAGTIGIIVAYLCAAVYLSYKLSVLYDEDNYLLIVFAALTLAMMVCTIVMAGVCMASFDKGLRTYTMPQKKVPEEDIYLNAYRQSYAYPPQSPRMDLVD